MRARSIDAGLDAGGKVIAWHHGVVELLLDCFSSSQQGGPAVADLAITYPPRLVPSSSPSDPQTRGPHSRQADQADRRLDQAVRLHQSNFLIDDDDSDIIAGPRPRRGSKVVAELSEVPTIRLSHLKRG